MRSNARRGSRPVDRDVGIEGWWSKRNDDKIERAIGASRDCIPSECLITQFSIGLSPSAVVLGERLICLT